MSKILTSLLSFQFSEQSGSRIPDSQPVKLIFSLIVTFYLTKTENSASTLSKGTILAKSTFSFQKNPYIGKIKRALVLKSIFSETTYGRVLTCQIQHSSIILTSFRQEVILPSPHPTSNRTPKVLPTQISIKEIQIWAKRLKIGARRFQIGAEITNQGKRVYKPRQGF